MKTILAHFARSSRKLVPGLKTRRASGINRPLRVSLVLGVCLTGAWALKAVADDEKPATESLEAPAPPEVEEATTPTPAAGDEGTTIEAGAIKDAGGVGGAIIEEAAPEVGDAAASGEEGAGEEAAMEEDFSGGAGEEDFSGGAGEEDFSGGEAGGEIDFSGGSVSDLFPPGASAPIEDGAADATDLAGLSEVTFKNATEAHARFLDLLESEKRFPAAATCAQCHPDHYREWSVSAHAYAQVSPVFNAMQAAIFQQTSGTNGDFCIRCHTQIGMQREEPIYTSNLKRHPASLEGITCVVCHRVDRNYGKVSGRTAVLEGDIYQPIYGPKGNEILKEVLAKNSNLKSSEEDEGQIKVHGEIKKFDPISTSAFCGSCHDVNLLNGFRLEEAFTQFKNSPAAKDGENCQDCHMGKVPGKKLDGQENFATGPAARIGGAIWAQEGDPEYGTTTTPRKRTNHMFVGPDYSIVHPGMFPHSKALRDKLWEWQHQEEQDGKTVVTERAGLSHILDFKWEEGWGDGESAFEKKVRESESAEAALPWPWDDRQNRSDFRVLLNTQFRLLNQISVERHQIMRRGFQLGKTEVTRDDGKGLEFRVNVMNGTDGHGVPTGFDAERMIFLNVKVKDAKGRVIYQSGDRDPNGDVRDLHSNYVHHNADKKGSYLQETAWKTGAGLDFLPYDVKWKEDKDLFHLQSKFLTRNLRGGEREQVLAVNHSIDPLPYIRPDITPGILVARPGGARKQARVLPPNGSRWAEYSVPAKALTGARPYTVEAKFFAQMVPVNLVSTIAYVGFDYNLSPKEVAKRVAYGHRVSPSLKDEDRKGGALLLWDKKFVIDGKRTEWDFTPTEAEIMAPGEVAFPYDPKFEETQAEMGGGGIIELSPDSLAPEDVLMETDGEESFGEEPTEESFGEEAPVAPENPEMEKTEEETPPAEEPEEKEETDPVVPTTPPVTAVDSANPSRRG